MVILIEVGEEEGKDVIDEKKNTANRVKGEWHFVLSVDIISCLPPHSLCHMKRDRTEEQKAGTWWNLGRTRKLRENCSLKLLHWPHSGS